MRYRKGLIKVCVFSAAITCALAASTLVAPLTLLAQDLPQDPGAATVTGTVTDSDGALVTGAKVTLSGMPAEATTVTDHDGHYHFDGVTAGDLTLTVSAAQLAPGKTTFKVQPGQHYETAPIVLRVVASSEVMVTLTPQDIAEEQIRTAETQRVIGLVPNYFVNYNRRFVPLTVKQKYGLGLHVVLDPTNFLFAGISAGIEQAYNTIPGYGQGAEGFGKRYGAALALSSSATMFRGSVYPALFHQDPRYFYKGKGTVWERTRYALATAVICKGDNGRWQPNYSGILGDLSAGALANAYYPATSRHGAALTFENGLLSTAGVGVGHVLQEFLFKHVTAHAPKSVPAARP
jgi:hypothetical protein